MAAHEGLRYGSDLIMDWLAQAGIRRVALNPGATLRGLHDSLVRHPTVRPVLALHEEIADLLVGARCPVVVVDRPVRGLAGPLLELAELLTAGVVDLGGGCNVPTTHCADHTAARREALGERRLLRWQLG